MGGRDIAVPFPAVATGAHYTKTFVEILIGQGHLIPVWIRFETLPVLPTTVFNNLHINLLLDTYLSRHETSLYLEFIINIE